MATNFRFLCSPGTPGPTVEAVAYYRTAPGQPASQIAAAAGTTVDVPDNGLARQDMHSQGWLDIGPSGTTAQRPAPSSMVGRFFVDTTVAKVIVSDGLTWRDPMTGNSV